MCLGHESLSFSELVRVPWRVDRTFKDRRAGPGQGTAREAQPTRDDVSKLLFSPVYRKLHPVERESESRKLIG
jgi:hypothetical protein